MKGIIETSVYLVIFALVCFFSIDFIRINQRVSDAGEISQYIENYIEAYCGDIPDSELSEEARDKKLYVLARSVQKGSVRSHTYNFPSGFFPDLFSMLRTDPLRGEA